MSIGIASDRAKIDAGAGSPAYETNGFGIEVAVANVLVYRWGHYEDKTGDIDGSTSGWAVGLPVGPWGGVLYERAQFPEARTLSDLTRKAFSIWIDPLAIWRLQDHPRR